MPLSDRGRAQAAGLRRWLRSLPPGMYPDQVYVSPYLRARQTLEMMLAGVPPVPVHVDERLRDRETGVLELLTPAAVVSRYPDEAARRHRVGDVVYRPPGGESLLDVALRLRSFLRDLPAGPRLRVLVVAHDATVLMLRAVIDGLDEAAVAHLMTHDRVRNASVSRWLRTRGRWVLDGYNDVSHLRAPT